MRTIVLAHEQMEPQLAELTREICARAGAEVRSWSSHSVVDDLGGRAALAVGMLPEGLRTIPEDLGALVTQRIPGLPLLLFAAEPLVRPALSLHEGLVTVVGPSPSPALAASCLRTLLADAPPVAWAKEGFWRAVVPEPDEAPTEVRRRAFRIGVHWVGVLEAGDIGRERATTRAWLKTAGGLGAALAAEAPSSQAQATVGVSEVRGEPHWQLQGQEGVSLMLLSSQRLPQLNRLVSAQRALPARPGDLVFAAALPTGPSAALEAELAARVADDEGGPALLDLVQRHLAAVGAGACLLVERCP